MLYSTDEGHTNLIYCDAYISLSLSEPHALILFSHAGGVSSVNAFTGAVAAVQLSGTVDAFDYHYTANVRVQPVLL